MGVSRAALTGCIVWWSTICRFVHTLLLTSVCTGEKQLTQPVPSEASVLCCTKEYSHQQKILCCTRCAQAVQCLVLSPNMQPVRWSSVLMLFLFVFAVSQHAHAHMSRWASRMMQWLCESTCCPYADCLSAYVALCVVTPRLRHARNVIIVYMTSCVKAVCTHHERVHVCFAGGSVAGPCISLHSCCAQVEPVLELLFKHLSCVSAPQLCVSWAGHWVKLVIRQY